MEDAVDYTSHANWEEVTVTHLDWTAVLDFERQVIVGEANLQCCVTDAGMPTEVKFDTKALDIHSVVLQDEDGEELQSWEGEGIAGALHGDSHEVFGQAIAVPLPEQLQQPGSTFTVKFRYNTTAEGGASQWLTQEQTNKKLYPFYFAQCQAIHARSLLPCMDSPAVRMTWSVDAYVPRQLVVIASALPADLGPEPAADAPEAERAAWGTPTAEEVDEPPLLSSDQAADASAGMLAYVDDRMEPEDMEPGWKRFRYHQPVAVPSYLVSLAAGCLERVPIGRRCAVFAEPGLAAPCAEEFVRTEDFLDTAEALLGEYKWQRWDMVIMPSSYPYGGMELPNSCYLTPTLIAGDGSLADVICHEICHSWVGNGVTCKTWRHFWLNEGFCMMAQRKTASRVAAKYAKPGQLLQGAEYFDFDAIGGEKDMLEAVRSFHDRSQDNFTVLVPDLRGVDPDDSFSKIPYEKGFYLLQAIQERVGEERFDEWLPTYVAEFTDKSITTAEFVRHVTTAFEAELADFPWAQWFDEEGDPPCRNTYSHRLYDQCAAVADAFVLDPSRLAASPVRSWAAAQKIAMLDRLTAVAAAAAALEPPRRIDPTAMAELDTRCKLSRDQNSEIRFRWRLLQVRSGIYRPRSEMEGGEAAAAGGADEEEEEEEEIDLKGGIQDCLDMMKEYGRMKFARVVFQTLLKDAEGRSAACALFRAIKGAYHPICASMMEKDMVTFCERPELEPTEWESLTVETFPLPHTMDSLPEVAEEDDEAAEEVKATADPTVLADGEEEAATGADAEEEDEEEAGDSDRPEEDDGDDDEEDEDEDDFEEPGNAYMSIEMGPDGQQQQVVDLEELALGILDHDQQAVTLAVQLGLARALRAPQGGIQLMYGQQLKAAVAQARVRKAEEEKEAKSRRQGGGVAAPKTGMLAAAAASGAGNAGALVPAGAAGAAGAAAAPLPPVDWESDAGYQEAKGMLEGRLAAKGIKRDLLNSGAAASGGGSGSGKAAGAGKQKPGDSWLDTPISSATAATLHSTMSWTILAAVVGSMTLVAFWLGRAQRK